MTGRLAVAAGAAVGVGGQATGGAVAALGLYLFRALAVREQPHLCNVRHAVLQRQHVVHGHGQGFRLDVALRAVRNEARVDADFLLHVHQHALLEQLG